MQEHGRPLRAPNWFNELQKRHSAMNMDKIILSVNCSYAVERLLTTHLKPLSPSRPDKTRFNTLLGNLATTFVASTSTLVYMGIQVFHSFVNRRSKPLLCTLVASIFQHTWLNVNIRSSQFLYWPVILQGSGSRLNYNVEYMHNVALRKHAVWSNITFDVILGFISGLLLLMHRQIIYRRIAAISGQITNDLLRSGCVWLMGVPAGFKLNTELAEMFGLISLNAIQIWSTLWFFMGSALPYAVIVLAFSGMFLGLTVLVALCMDILKIATVHISILHWFISFIYSLQILALSSLWRLFRGQKWNPLRKRLDSFDYTVEEHVVGALLFTPILLLLPTTSVFYMFFTMVNSFISLTCILIEIMISLLHATPYAEIFLWMLKKGRFPSGIWFETLSICSTTSATTPINGSSDSNLTLLDENLRCSPEISTLVSVLHNNHATIGQILRPKIREVFNGVSMSLSSFFEILSGQSIPSTTRTGVPPAMPWMNLSYHDYWRLCRKSILEHVFYST